MDFLGLRNGFYRGNNYINMVIKNSFDGGLVIVFFFSLGFLVVERGRVYRDIDR